MSVKRNRPGLKVQRFFDTVRDDLEKLPDAVEYYHKAVTDGGKHVPIVGRLEDLLAETPGLIYFYQGIRTDAQQLRRWMETVVGYEVGSKYKWFNHEEESKRDYGELKHTEILKYIDADDEISDLKGCVRMLAECEHLLEDLISSLENRSIMLSKIVDVRKAGVQEVWVDPYQETKNE